MILEVLLIFSIKFINTTLLHKLKIVNPPINRDSQFIRKSFFNIKIRKYRLRQHFSVL